GRRRSPANWPRSSAERRHSNRSFRESLINHSPLTLDRTSRADQGRSLESSNTTDNAMATATAAHTGNVTQIIGSTFDVEFSAENLPEIYNAILVEQEIKGVQIRVVGEVQQHLGGGRVRCVALGSTDGMIRGMEVTDTGEPVSVPVGKETLGRVFNVLGDPIDGRGPVETAERWPIHRNPPALEDLSSKTEVFETGIKVVDLLT